MSVFRLDSLIHTYYCMDINHSIPSQEREGSCVRDMYIDSVSIICRLIDIGTVLTMSYFLLCILLYRLIIISLFKIKSIALEI